MSTCNAKDVARSDSGWLQVRCGVFELYGRRGAMFSSVGPGFVGVGRRRMHMHEHTSNVIRIHATGFMLVC